MPGKLETGIITYFKWNKDGIPGVDNGQQKTAIFIDDVLHSGRWASNGPQTFQPFISCPTFNLITTHNWDC